MDSTSGKTDKPKLEELSREQLIVLLRDAMERIKSLEKKLNETLPPKLPVPYSVRSAEARKKRQKELDSKKKEKKKPLRSGRIKTDEKIAKAKRHEDKLLILLAPSSFYAGRFRDSLQGFLFALAKKFPVGFRRPDMCQNPLQGLIAVSVVLNPSID